MLGRFEKQELQLRSYLDQPALEARHKSRNPDAPSTQCGSVLLGLLVPLEERRLPQGMRQAAGIQRRGASEPQRPTDRQSRECRVTEPQQQKQGHVDPGT